MTNFEDGYIKGALDERKRILKDLRDVEEHHGKVDILDVINVVEGKVKR